MKGPGGIDTRATEPTFRSTRRSAAVMHGSHLLGPANLFAATRTMLAP
jgi:hypothetical protein